MIKTNQRSKQGDTENIVGIGRKEYQSELETRTVKSREIVCLEARHWRGRKRAGEGWYREVWQGFGRKAADRWKHGERT